MGERDVNYTKQQIKKKKNICHTNIILHILQCSFQEEKYGGGGGEGVGFLSVSTPLVTN